MLSLNNLAFSVPKRQLLQPMSLQFATGCVTGLIGHNGSGKSTLLKLLAKQLKPSAGEVLLNGVSLQQWQSKAFAREVAYLPQHLPAATGLTASELVQMGRFAWHGLMSRNNPDDERIIAQALQLTHTEAYAHQLIDTLSGGERHRVFLAMCVAQQSRYLLLDEPLAALDLAHQLEVIQLVRLLAHDLGIGVIIVIHDINLAAQYCDRLIAIKQGQLLYDESPANLMTQTKLHDIYGVQLNLLPHPSQPEHTVALL